MTSYLHHLQIYVGELDLSGSQLKLMKMPNKFKQEAKAPPQPAPRARERIESAATEDKKVTKNENPTLSCRDI